MAAFLVAFPGWTKSDYLALTLRERDALIDAYNTAHKTR